MSALDDRTSSICSVHCTDEGSQSTFFRATLRLRTCVRRRCVFGRSQRILATELPTVPKPSRATLQRCASRFFSPAAALLPGALRLGGRVIFLLSPKGNEEGAVCDEFQAAHARPSGAWTAHPGAWGSAGALAFTETVVYNPLAEVSSDSGISADFGSVFVRRRI